MKQLRNKVHSSGRLHQDNQVFRPWRLPSHDLQPRARKLRRCAGPLAIEDTRIRPKTRAVGGGERLAQALSRKYAQDVIWNASTGFRYGGTHRAGSFLKGCSGEEVALLDGALHQGFHGAALLGTLLRRIALGHL